MSVSDHRMRPFDRDGGGAPVPGAAREMPDGDRAMRMAQALASTHLGAIAFSRTGDPDSGSFEDAVVTAEFGEADNGSMSG